MSIFYKVNDNTQHKTNWYYKPEDNVWHHVKNVYTKQENEPNGEAKWHPAWLYNWITEKWQKCSKQCGGGKQIREVVCTRNDGITRPELFCSGIPKPISSQECNAHECKVTVLTAGDDWWLLRGYNPTTGAIKPTYYDCRYNYVGIGCGQRSVSVPLDLMTEDGKLYLHLTSYNREHTWMSGYMTIAGKYGKIVKSSFGRIGSSSTYSLYQGYATHWMIAEWILYPKEEN